MTSNRNNWLRKLGVQHSIIQAPMVGVSTPRLAAAVSNAGALGSIGVGASTAQQARTMIVETRALTDRPFNVNLFCHRPAARDTARESAWLEHLAPLFAEFDSVPPAALHEIYQSFVSDDPMLQMLLDERPAVVSFHFGLPSIERIEALREAGIATLACATSLDEARAAQEARVDAIVAQGAEAGGHRGVFEPGRADTMLGTLPLVRSLAKDISLPIIAAGGIMDGQGIAAALALGASAAQLGTAFVLTPESAANDAYRAALQSARANQTAFTSAISGRPARGLLNRMHTDAGATDAPSTPDYPVAYDAAKALNAAAIAKGNHDFAVQWAGQGARLARAMPASELINELVRELNDALAMPRSA